MQSSLAKEHYIKSAFYLDQLETVIGPLEAINSSGDSGVGYGLR